VTLRLTYLMLARVLGWLALLAGSDPTKDIEILVLGHEVAVLHRHNPRPALTWIDRAFPSALSRLLPRELRRLRLVSLKTLPRWHAHLIAAGPTRGRDRAARPPTADPDTVITTETRQVNLRCVLVTGSGDDLLVPNAERP
jgi:putative transposase